jgi:formylglycine-generating enzyme required for sulfatase activity
VHDHSCYHPDGNYSANYDLRPYLIDRTPVTNAQYRRFLEATGYRPPDPANFLRHWVDGSYSDGKADHPVTYVSVDDARAYAEWAGKRPRVWTRCRWTRFRRARARWAAWTCAATCGR